MLSLSLLIGSFVHAQTEVGARIGLNFGNASLKGISESIDPDFKNITRFKGGIFVNQPLDDLLSLQSGLYFTTKGFEYGESFPVTILGADIPIGARAITEMQYIEVPLLLQINPLKDAKVQPYVAVGPTIGYAVNGQVDTKATFIIDFNINTFDLDLTKDMYNRFEFGGQGMLGVKIPYGKGNFDFGMSYSQAFSKIIDDTILDIQVRNKAFGLHAGFSMNLNGSTANSGYAML